MDRRVIRRSAIGTAVLVTTLAVFGVAPVSPASASPGETTMQCVGADDDAGAIVSEVAGELTTATALSFAGYGNLAPQTLAYDLSALPTFTTVGTSIPVDFDWTADSTQNDQLVEGFGAILGLTEAAFDPQMVELRVVGPATATGLSFTHSGSYSLTSPSTSVLSMSGTLTATGTGLVQVYGHQRITFVVNKHIDYSGIGVQVNTLTVECETGLLGEFLVVEPGAPLAYDDTTAPVSTSSPYESAVATFTAPIDVDVLANDVPSDASLPIDATTLSIVDTGFLQAEVVDGKIRVSGYDLAGAIGVDGVSGLCSYPEFEVLSSEANGDIVIETVLQRMSCALPLVYSVCSSQGACSQATLEVLLATEQTDTYTYGYSDEDSTGGQAVDFGDGGSTTSSTTSTTAPPTTTSTTTQPKSTVKAVTATPVPRTPRFTG